PPRRSRRSGSIVHDGCRAPFLRPVAATAPALRLPIVPRLAAGEAFIRRPAGYRAPVLPEPLRQTVARRRPSRRPSDLLLVPTTAPVLHGCRPGVHPRMSGRTGFPLARLARHRSQKIDPNLAEYSACCHNPKWQVYLLGCKNDLANGWG